MASVVCVASDHQLATTHSAPGRQRVQPASRCYCVAALLQAAHAHFFLSLFLWWCLWPWPCLWWCPLPDVVVPDPGAEVGS